VTTIDSPPTPAPIIDPRLRQRWINARREEGRKRLHLFLATAVLLAVLAAGFGALHTPLFKVRHVRVAISEVPAGSGLTTGQIEAQAGLDRERLMVGVATGSMARLIEQLPWVASAQVERDWPATVRIAVTTRRPVAEVERVSGQPASGFALLDTTGRVLVLLSAGGLSEGTPSAAGPEFPVLPLLGSLPSPGAPGTWILPPNGGTGQVAAEELATATALPPALERRVSSITVTARGLVLRVGSVMVLFGDAGELRQKVTSLETLLADVSLTGISAVDLRVPDRPALTPSLSTASVSTAAGG
jgi:cell division septal protein FtsQ